MELNLKTIAARVIWLRENKHMKPADLCRAARLRQPSLWAIENGRTKTLKAPTLFRLAAALSANPKWIQDGAGEPYSDPSFTASDSIELDAILADLDDARRSAILAFARTIRDTK